MRKILQGRLWVLLMMTILLVAFSTACSSADTKEEEADKAEGEISGELEIQYFVGDRKSTRLNSSHVAISYAVFCLKKKNNAWSCGVHGWHDDRSFSALAWV